MIACVPEDTQQSRLMLFLLDAEDGMSGNCLGWTKEVEFNSEMTSEFCLDDEKDYDESRMTCCFTPQDPVTTNNNTSMKRVDNMESMKIISLWCSIQLHQVPFFLGQLKS